MLPRLSSLLRNVLRKGRVERDLDREVRSYVDTLTDEKTKAGMSPEEARRSALIDLGCAEQVKEQVRDVRTGALLEQLWQDIRYGCRMLRKSPAFTTMTLLTLALAIGANTAIFSLIHTLSYRPLSVANPEELAEIRNVVGKPRTGSLW